MFLKIYFTKFYDLFCIFQLIVHLVHIRRRQENVFFVIKEITKMNQDKLPVNHARMEKLLHL